jgi:hypothetical protein
MPRSEVRFLINYPFGDNDGLVAAERIDRRLAALPGLEGLSLVRGVVEEFAAIS